MDRESHLWSSDVSHFDKYALWQSRSHEGRGPWERGWHSLAPPKPSQGFTMKALLRFRFILLVYLFVYYYNNVFFWLGWLRWGGGGWDLGPFKVTQWLKPTRKWEQLVPSVSAPNKEVNVLKVNSVYSIDLFYFSEVSVLKSGKKTSTHRWANVLTSKRLL